MAAKRAALRIGVQMINIEKSGFTLLQYLKPYQFYIRTLRNRYTLVECLHWVWIEVLSAFTIDVMNISMHCCLVIRHDSYREYPSKYNVPLHL